MGQVRFVQRAAVEQQLAAGNLVLLTNVGVSSSGELLNCNAFDVSFNCCLRSIHCIWYFAAAVLSQLPACCPCLSHAAPSSQC